MKSIGLLLRGVVDVAAIDASVYQRALRLRPSLVHELRIIEEDGLHAQLYSSQVRRGFLSPCTPALLGLSSRPCVFPGLVFDTSRLACLWSWRCLCRDVVGAFGCDVFLVRFLAAVCRVHPYSRGCPPEHPESAVEFRYSGAISPRVAHGISGSAARSAVGERFRVGGHGH